MTALVPADRDKTQQVVHMAYSLGRVVTRHTMMAIQDSMIMG